MQTWMIETLGFAFGLFAENFGEWAMHKYLLHGLGKRRESFWSFHIYEHHTAAARNGMVDAGYREWPLHWNVQGKEALVLSIILLVQLPLFWWVPGFAAGMYAGVFWYYARHRRAHLDPAWAREHMPWHYAHHMGSGGENYWCISWPWFDLLCRAVLRSWRLISRRSADN